MGKTIRGPIKRRIGPGRQRPNPHPPQPPASSLFEDSLTFAQPSFALAVSHCPWRADRAATMERVRPTIARPGTPYCEITDRAPNHVWSRKMWGWGASQATTHTVYLQDDLRIHDQFWPVVEAMVRAVPNRVISLISNHPLSDRALAEGHAWFRMSETLGSGYIVPTVLMGAFLEWRDHNPAHVVADTCEDFLLTRWEAATGRRSWCPIPTVIQTIDDIATTNPKISYPFRRSYITWDDPRVAGRPITDVAFWTPQQPPPDFGPSVGNDSRLPRGPFANQDILDAHYRLARKTS